MKKSPLELTLEIHAEAYFTLTALGRLKDAISMADAIEIRDRLYRAAAKATILVDRINGAELPKEGE